MKIENVNITQDFKDQDPDRVFVAFKRREFKRRLNRCPQPDILVKGGDAPRYAEKIGSLLYTHLGELFAVPWRPSQPDLGRAVPVAAPGCSRPARPSPPRPS